MINEVTKRLLVIFYITQFDLVNIQYRTYTTKRLENYNRDYS